MVKDHLVSEKCLLVNANFDSLSEKSEKSELVNFDKLTFLQHQENSIRLERLAPDTPDAPRLPYLVWRHNDGRDAIKFSCPRIQF